MKKIVTILVALLMAIGLNAQVSLGEAPGDVSVNHNQRLIVRDSGEGKFVAFPYFSDDIGGIMYNDSIGDWSELFIITAGKSPTLAISDNNQIHLIYETLDEPTQIRYRNSWDFTNWSDEIILSDTSFRCFTPIADVDSSNTLNVFWIQDNTDSTQSLLYAMCIDGNLVERKTVLTKNEIKDLAMANHLQYYTDELYFAIQYNQDSVRFYHSYNHLQNFEMIYDALGKSPCITYNTSDEFSYDSGSVRMLYLNQESYLMEAEIQEGNGYFYEEEMIDEAIDNVWVNNLAPPIGYSFLYAIEDELVHEFSYGPHWNFNTTLEIIDVDSYEFYASIAYKHFNFDFVDLVWNESGELLYMRDEKYIYPIGYEDNEAGKGFSITGNPNPFSVFITLTISVEDALLVPEIQIYNTKMQLVRTFKNAKASNAEYSFQWNGTNTVGEKVKPGIYVIVCSVGDKRTARKIVYQP
jgi:hypothetical protein